LRAPALLRTAFVGVTQTLYLTSATRSPGLASPGRAGCGVGSFRLDCSQSGGRFPIVEMHGETEPGGDEQQRTAGGVHRSDREAVGRDAAESEGDEPRRVPQHVVEREGAPAYVGGNRRLKGGLVGDPPGRGPDAVSGPGDP